MPGFPASFANDETLIDIIASLVLLGLLSPVMAVVRSACFSTSARRCCSASGARASRGRPFTLYKFRTMRGAHAGEPARIPATPSG